MTGIDAAMIGMVVSETIELKTSQANKRWAAFNIGVGEGDGRQYVRVSVFNGLAERAAAELTKGTKVYVEANSLRISEWTDREGRQRHGLQAVGSKIEKIGTSNIGRNKPPRPKAPRQDEQPASNGQADGAARDWQRPPAEAEIPF